MAPSDDRSNCPSTNNDNENPFISFKRYADEQLSSILKGVLDFPSAFTSSSKDRWNAFDDEARRRSLERDARLEGQDKERSSTPEGSDDTADESNDTCNYGSYSVPSVLTCPINSAVLSYFDQWGSPAAFPVAYAVLSPYSPIQLQEHEKLRKYGLKWRHAFEDLMALQAGLEMPSESERATREHCSNFEWIRSMLERGNFGRWKPISSEQDLCTILSKVLDAREGMNDADEDNDFTELDLYGSFLGMQSPPPSSETPSFASESSSGPLSSESVTRLLPDRPALAISNIDLLGRALNAAKKAVENDNAGNYKEASELYHQCLSNLFMALTREQSDEAKEMIRTKISDYTDRVYELRTSMERDDEADVWKPAAVGSTEKASTAHRFDHTDNNQGKPSIISTLTTTEKRTLPDGTVHTKVVLKKRFADGNEESSETVHTTRGSEVQSQAQTTQAGGVKDELVKKNATGTKEEKSKAKEEKSQIGWFWT